MGIGLTILSLVLGGGFCVMYGRRIRRDERLRLYRARDPFRQEQEREGRAWVAGGAVLFAIAIVLWWFARE